MNTKRYLIGGLILSIALNLVLVGVLVGRAVTLSPGMRVDTMISMRRLLHDLPEERIAVLRPHYRDYMAHLRPGFRDIRGAQATLRKAMLTEPFEPSAVEAALKMLNSHLFDTQGKTHQALISLLSALTAEERSQLAAYLAEPVRRGEGPPRPRAGRSQPNSRHGQRQSGATPPSTHQ